LAYTKPRQETIAQLNLQQQSFGVYLPMYKKFKSSDKGSAAIFEPMFPRYILFRPSHSEQSLSTVRNTKGISNIVCFGFEPARLQDDLVQRIRQLEQERDQVPIEDLRQLKSGSTVRLKNTALGDVEGFVHSVSGKRVSVLLKILGQATLVQLGHHQVELTS
jgi:transcriptional antiterminator RfaH